ncbi:hypothetical protein EHF44_07655 [Cupriavidus pauculus]|uniref:Uncharacterized protein n=2 Tax=Cupriavidus pauculus TaxID=82633 RepID=A0A3G8GYI1_9BURK|nr:hypothetical protein EHF44_07655 [Cupriavidus pauculus]
MTQSARPARPMLPRVLPAMAAACLLAACSSTPTPPQVTPINATVKLGRVTEKTFVSRVEVPQGSSYGGYSSVGGVAAGGGGGGGGAVGVGFAVDLTQLFRKPQPPLLMDLFQYKVRTADGLVAEVNGPAAPGLEPGACVRLIYPDGTTQPQLAPSNEC